MLRYAGEYWDDTTGLQYLRARWYDPSMGRFMGEDTYQGEIVNPLTMNWYTYVSNNPLKYVDPSGHREEWGSGGSGGDSFSFWENEWYLLKQSHSSMYSTIDFWTYGSMAQLNEYYRVSQENPYSLEHFLQAGLIAVEIVPIGRGTGKVARLTEDGAEYVNSAINKALRSCNCFAAGTKVQTDEGEQNIEDIKVGDMVLAKNEETGEQAHKEVTHLYRNDKEIIYELTIGNQVIETTDNHPFWVEGKGWVLAVDLQVGDKLQQSNGNTLVIDRIKLVKHDELVKVYNFTVADFHTYFVSDLGIWVHNISCAEINWKGFSSGKLKTHYEKHGHEFGEITQNEYLKRAKGFAAETNSTFKEEVVASFLVKYDPSTGRVLIGHINNREIRTFYIDDGRDADVFQAAKDLAVSKSGL